MSRLVTVLAAIALVAAPAGRATVTVRPQDVPAAETRTITVDFGNDLNAPVASLTTRIPDNAVLVAATASDSSWIAARTGRTLEWRGGRLDPGTHLQLRLALRFTRAGESVIGTRMTYASGASQESPLLVDVHGTPSQTDVVVVIAAGVAIFVGAILVFVVGRRALRG
jgi:hypothetical protein